MATKCNIREDKRWSITVERYRCMTRHTRTLTRKNNNSHREKILRVEIVTCVRIINSQLVWSRL